MGRAGRADQEKAHAPRPTGGRGGDGERRANERAGRRDKKNTRDALKGLRLLETITLTSVSLLQWKMDKLIGGVEGLP